MNEIKGKILSIVGLTAIAALNVVDNKKADASNLVQKANYVAKYKIVSPNTEAVVQRCSVKKVFQEVSQNSQENTCATLLK